MSHGGSHSRSNEAFAEPPPSIAGTTAESLRLKTSDNEEIGGWLVRGDADKPCVLLLHGNGGSPRRDAAGDALACRFAIHRPGDQPSRPRRFDRQRERHRLERTARRRGGRSVPAARVSQAAGHCQGRSLGAAAAIFAAEDLKADVAGYFLEQPYKDLKSAVWNRLQHHLPPVLDWVAYGGLRLWSPAFLPVDPDRISPYDRIAVDPSRTCR